MVREIVEGSFVWDESKEVVNKHSHGLDFKQASQAFFDPDRLIATDEVHSQEEERYFCVGKIGNRIATVRFTYRGDKICLIGAGYWRKGRQLYEKKNKKNT